MAHPYKRGQNRPFLGQTPPTVQSAGELEQPQGARKTLEPERGRKVQGEKSLTARNQNAEPKEISVAVYLL